MRTLTAMGPKLHCAAAGLGLFFAACVAPAVAPPSTDDAGTAAPDQALATTGGRIIGTVIDLARKGVPGASIRLCSTSCREVLTDSTGTFEITSVTAASYGLHAELPGTQPLDMAKVVVPIYYYDPRVDPVRTVAPIPLPFLYPAPPLSAGKQTVAIDTTLSLTVDADALTFPAGAQARQLAGVRVPPGLYPDFCLPSSDGRILAEWALGPFGTTSSAPITVHIADNLGLAPGSTVLLSSIDPDFGSPERQSLGRVADDGKTIDSIATMELHRLTWLVVSLPRGGP